MQSGLVTTIIPVFNRATMLCEAVSSVLAQTYRPIEILIVDDGSTDGTGAVADSLAAAHPEIRVLHQENRGVGLARETGRLAIRGEFVQHLDSDDLLYPRKFELEVAALRAHPECGAAYGWTRGRGPDGKLSAIPEKRTAEIFETMFPAMLQSRIWHTPTPLYRAPLVRQAGPWLALVNEEDWEFDARIASFGVRLAHVPEWGAEVRHHAGERLSGFGLRPRILCDRAKAHEQILHHARRAGIGDDAPEMRHYARELFLLSRQCGAAGLREESKRLFTLSREASGKRAHSVQFLLYAALARIAGWSATGKLATMADGLRWRKSRS